MRKIRLPRLRLEQLRSIATHALDVPCTTPRGSMRLARPCRSVRNARGHLRFHGDVSCAYAEPEVGVAFP